MKRILLCCSAGASSSILVKSMREAASSLNYECKIAAVNVDRVYLYIHKVDVVLVAPQCRYDFNRIQELSKSYHVPVFLIGREEYGRMDGLKVLKQLLQHFNEKEEDVKMDKLSLGLEKYLLPITNKFASNPILTIIRDAMSSTISLLIIGSISILLTSFPHDGIAAFLAPSNDFFNTIYACTSGMYGLIMSAAIAYYASREYKTTPLVSVLTSTATFLVTQSVVLDGWPTINVDGLGVSGLLTAILAGIVTVYILHFFEQKKIVIKMPNGVPPAVAESFTSLLPSFVVLGLFTFLIRVLGLNINSIVGTLLSPLSNMLNSLPGYVIYHMLCAIVFFCGINSAVVIGVVQAFLTSNSIANDTATAAGMAVENIVTNSVDTMMWAGGTGATIGLVLLMVFLSKSKMMKTLGRISLAPAIFNINEPVIFGTPIAFNPLFLFPFVLTPGIISGLTYFLMDAGIIAMPILGNVPWTVPPVLVGFMMSGGAISTTIWSFCIVIISVLIYYPFFKIADKQMYEKEQEEM